MSSDTHEQNAVCPATSDNSDLHRIELAVGSSANQDPPYFWGQGGVEDQIPKGYIEARSIIGDGSLEILERLSDSAMQSVALMFEGLEKSKVGSQEGVVELHLSDDLQKWREDQHAAGRVLPGKGNGFTLATDVVIQLLGAEKWPTP